jgi:hypothetical protein
MASYTFPGNVTTYVPTLSLDLMVEFNRTEFPINRYIGRKKVDKEKGFYTQMKNDNQARFTSPAQFIWQDGNDAPKILGTGSDSFTFPAYSTLRYCYPEQLGYLAVEQGSWDVLGQASRLRTMQGMTARSYRLASLLTTSTNYPTANYSATATALAGGTWTSATSTNPYIKKSILSMTQTIVQQTFGVVQPKDLYLVVNPNTAIIVAQSAEFIDLLKQSPVAINIFEGTNYNSRFGLPDSIYGVNLVVDDTVYNSAGPGAASSLSYTVADNVAFITTKQDAINPSVGQAFSSAGLLTYEDWSVNVFNDLKNRRYDLQVTENTAEVMFAGQAGYLIADVHS